MSHAEGHQAIKARASKQDLQFFGGADFLAASGGLALSFCWGFFEATFFFVVPDVLLSLVATVSFRRVWRHMAAAIAGAVCGGAVMFFWAQENPAKAYAAVRKVPFITERMFAQVEAGYQKNGMAAVYLGPMSGTPYKIYAVEAPRFFRATPFLLTTIPARGWRFVLVGLFAAACAAILRRRWNKSVRELTILHALAWALFYISYWTRISMN
jgi:membrane protein YqaA with SNARE-associated domain